MEYSGEHLWVGIWGQGSVLIALLTACLAAALFLIPAGNLRTQRFATGAFLLHTAGVVMASLALLIMIFGHYFEYHYVWQYTSTDLPAGYLLSSFWAGKEGSMLLWLLFQALLGTVLVFDRRTPGRVKGVIAIAQCLLSLMLVGFDLGGLQTGRSPFVLLRELPEYASMPLFTNASYLNFLTEGNGLNPLLRNPWMAIHPPVLFLGYAACLIPYAWSLAGDVKEKDNPSAPLFWTVFSVMCLGAGLILGGAWAYEDLTFGGFWSWDPVENASLVPWLLMLASLHFLLNPKFRNTGIRFMVAPYIAVLFAAYLTRSGVLQNASVHSFSGGQGSALLLSFTVLALLMPLLMALLRKKEPQQKTRETFSSPEIWLFIGAALLALSAFQVLFVTAIPALNAWFGLPLAPPSHPVSFYNQWQQWFAACAALATGITLYLKSNRHAVSVIKTAAPVTAVTLLILLLLVWLAPPLNVWLYPVVGCVLFAGLAMLDGMLRLQRSRSNFAADITHLGVAVFLLGTILTFSWESPLGPADPKNPRGLQTLVLGQIKPLKQGYVSYAGRQVTGDEITYRLDFLYKANDNQYYLDYTLFPAITEQEGMGPVPKPDTRKTLTEDIFVHLTHAEITRDAFQPVSNGKVAVGDTLAGPSGFVVLDSLTETRRSPQDSLQLDFRAWCRFQPAGREAVKLQPSLSLDHGEEIKHDALHEPYGIRLSLVYPVARDTAWLELAAKKTDYVVLSARVFPYINILWLGIFVMAVGISISLGKRIKIKK